MDLAFQIATFFAGLVFGSFLNVCISRLPRDESIVSPGSRCPHCRAPIRWQHNIPLLSYLLLRGRCADCGEKISWRYPVVELLTAVLFALVASRFGVSWFTLKFCVFCFLVLGLIFMDAETGLLPAEFTYTGIVLGLGFSWFAPVDSAATRFLFRLWNVGTNLGGKELSLADALAAALFGLAFFYFFWAIYYVVRRRSGMGFGDFALSAMAGAFLGLKLLLVALFIAPPLAAVISLSFARSSFGMGHGNSADQNGSILQRQIPFGVYLGVASLLAFFFGERAWSMYLAWASS